MAATNEWTVFSSRKKYAPRNEFSDEASRAFGKRREEGRQGAMAAFGGSGADASISGAVSARGSHNDTSAFGNRSGGRSVFNDAAANAFGKRGIQKRFDGGVEETRPAYIMNTSLAAHLVGFAEFDEKKEWKQSALRRGPGAAAAEPKPTLSAAELFPALPTKTPVSSPVTGSLHKSDSKNSFKDIMSRRIELDAEEEARTALARQELEKAEREKEEIAAMARHSRNRAHAVYAARAAAAGAPPDTYEHQEPDEDDLDVGAYGMRHSDPYHFPDFEDEAADAAEEEFEDREDGAVSY